ncbi:GNAT family N-acetyltransferase [Humibacter ginsengisoli]
MATKVRDDAVTDIRVEPVGDVPWSDVRTVFGTRGDPATCWCQFFKLSNAQWRETDVPTLESALCEQVRREPGPGLIAYVGDEPAGWVAVEPRSAYPRLRTSRIVAQGRPAQQHDDPSVWSITCFVVRVGFRRRGVASALLTAAVEHARVSGARIVEAYPVDTDERTASSAELFHGVLSVFVGAGFDIVSRPQPGRAVVSLTL